MTDRDLATLVHEHVAREEPPFGLSAETAMALGRRTLVRRRARRALAGVIVAAAAVVAVPLLPHHPGDRDAGVTGHRPTAPREAYDAQKMPDIFETHVRAALGDGLQGLGQRAFVAFDDNDTLLDRPDYDRASGMEIAFSGPDGRRVTVTMWHVRTATQGDPRAMCRRNVAMGIDFSCTVTTSADGDPVVTTVDAFRVVKPGPGGESEVLKPDQLTNGSVDPAQVYFAREVRSVRMVGSGPRATQLTNAIEIVRAPDVGTAERRWRIPVPDLAKIATDPALVIPVPRP